VTRCTFGRIVALVVVLMTVVVASGCSSTLRDAATVTPKRDDSDESAVHIRRDDFEDEVEALSQSPQVRQQLAQAGVSDKAPASGTADAKLSAFWLTSLIQNVAVQQEFDARGLELSDAELAQAANGLSDLGDLPKAVQDKIAASQAMQQKLIAEIGARIADPTPPSDEQLRAFYDQNSAAITTCASGKEVSHILVADAATANDLAQQLAAGASFADLARANSTDDQSAAAGGSLGCLGAQQYVAEFQQAADSAPLNQVVGPVQTEFGYHLILVTPWAPTFEKFRDQLAQQATSQTQQQVQQQRSQLYGEAITKRLDAMEVKVDPRYGRWDTESGQYQVVAPSAPNPRTEREPTTTTTSIVPGVIGG
jgi:parvulin-like peptidyl-prolyl isomerase